MRPVERLEHERDHAGAARAEDDAGDRHALRLFPVRRDRRTLLRQHGEARVGMRGGRARCPRPTLPVEQPRRWLGREAFPPRLARRREGDVGEDRVALHHRGRIGIRLGTRVRRDTEEAALGIDRAQLPGRVDVNPRDVVAHRPHAPARQRRHGHGEIGLARRARHGRRDIRDLALRVLDADDQHVLREPAFLARLPRSEPQRVTLLAEQRVAAVAGAHAPDELFLGEVQDQSPLRRQIAERVHAGDEVVVASHRLDRGLAHAGHDVHAGHDIGAVGHHDAGAAHGGAGGTHQVRDDVHRAPAHGAFEVLAGLRLGFRGSHPVVGRAGVLALARADEGELLRPRDVGGVAAMQVTARIGARVERQQRAVAQHRFDQAVVFLLGAVAPYDIGGSGHAGSAFDPLLSHAGRAHGRTPGSMKIRPPGASIVRGGWGRVKQLLAAK